MFGWHEIQHYHPLVAVGGGICALFALKGLGGLTLRVLRVPAKGALGPAIELLLGLLIVSLVVQTLAFADHSTPQAARILAILLIPAAAVSAAADLRKLAPFLRRASTSATSTGVWVLAAMVAVALLAAAIAPESRSDEASYHALVPARILEDGGLRVYELPWEATIWPQMLWHYALVPVFATAGSAAARVLSCCLTILLALTASQIVRDELKDEKFAGLACLAVLAGVYPATIMVTLGPHAFGCLATFAACWSVLPFGGKGEQGSGKWSTSIACAAMVAGKVTMFPLATLILWLASGDIASPGEAFWRRVKTVLSLAMPMMIVLAPILIWGWTAAHSPMGVMTAEFFHSAAFGPEAIRAYRGVRELFADQFNWRFELSYWDSLVVIGAACSVLIVSESRLRCALLLGCQSAVIVFALPKEIRHLGGLQYALFVVGFCALIASLRVRRVSGGWIVTGSLVAIAPWVVLGCYITSINLPLLAGRESAQAFLRQYSGLYAEYERLDRILPAEAVIVLGHSETSPSQSSWFARPPTFYAPRAVLNENQLASSAAPAFLLYVGEGELDPTQHDEPIPFDPLLPAGFSVGRFVYRNDAALFYPSRTPNSAAGRRTRIEVFELDRARSPIGN